MSCCTIQSPNEVRGQRTLLWTVLLINSAMFAIEVVSGYLAGSSALIGDSLDMLGDTLVYGLSLLVISKDAAIRARASTVKGYVMLALGLYVLVATAVKAGSSAVPAGNVISAIGIAALIANGICFLLLSRRKRPDINIRAAWICSRNDVIANLSVIVAGVLVRTWNTLWPDLLVGAGISILVIYSGVRVIRDSGGKHLHCCSEVAFNDDR